MTLKTKTAIYEKDFNRVKKENDRCWFMGCKGKVKFKGEETLKKDKKYHDGKSKYHVFVCPECKVEHYKKLKKEAKNTKK
jgi:hypothetical protein